MMTVSIADTTMKAATATAPASLFPVGEAEDIMDAIGKKGRSLFGFGQGTTFFVTVQPSPAKWANHACMNEHILWGMS